MDKLIINSRFNSRKFLVFQEVNNKKIIEMILVTKCFFGMDPDSPIMSEYFQKGLKLRPIKPLQLAICLEKEFILQM